MSPSIMVGLALVTGLLIIEGLALKLQQPRCRQSSLDMAKGPTEPVVVEGYSDEAFGLIFLTGVLIERDPAFSASFAFLSGVAAATYKEKDVSKELAAVVATSATCILSLLVSKGLVLLGSDLSQSPTMYELIVSLVGIGWNLQKSRGPGKER